MRVVTVSILLLILVGTASATIDPDTDQVGVYFDTSAESVCSNVAAGEMFDVYVILTNPSAAEIGGVELRLCTDVVDGPQEAIALVSELFYLCGTEFDFRHPCEDGKVLGCPSLTTIEGDTVLLLSFRYYLFEPVEVNFYLSAVPDQTIEDGLPAYWDGEVAYPMGVTSGDTSLPVASVNGQCQIVGSDHVTLDAMKSLYR